MELDGDANTTRTGWRCWCWCAADRIWLLSLASRRVEFCHSSSLARGGKRRQGRRREKKKRSQRKNCGDPESAPQRQQHQHERCNIISLPPGVLLLDVGYWMLGNEGGIYCVGKEIPI